MSQPEVGSFDAITWARGLAGATAGAVAGYYLFGFMLQFNFYALVIPGALVGMGCAWASKVKSVPLGITCGIFASLLCLWMNWKYLYSQNSFAFYLQNVTDLSPIDLIMIALGGLAGYWCGSGR